MSFPYQGVDVSWPQGSFKPTSEDFVIVGAATDDSGRESTQSTYHEQVDNARAAGKEVGHYFFNGTLDPATFAAYCASILYHFEAGDTVWLDVETQSNGGAAYSPAQALAFATAFHAKTGVVPGLYLNWSEVHSFNWTANVSAGQVLWLADYTAAMPSLAYWGQAVMWQHADTPDDLDYAAYTQAQIRNMQNGHAIPTPTPIPNQEEEHVTYAKTTGKTDPRYPVLVPGMHFVIDHAGRSVRMIRLPDEIVTLNDAGVTWVDVPGDSICHYVLPGSAANFTPFARIDW